MGKGDRKSKKGKIWRGSYGKRRPRANNLENSPDTPKPKTKKKVEPKSESKTKSKKS